MAEYDQLPERAKAALWHYMVEDGGVEDSDYEKHVRKFTYALRSYSPRSVVSAWKKMGWRTAGQGPRAKLDPHDEKRVRDIERLRAKGQHVWPYIVGFGTSFKEWASDEMNHGDGFHRAMASVRAGQPVEFLFLTQKPGARYAESIVDNLLESGLRKS